MDWTSLANRLEHAPGADAALDAAVAEAFAVDAAAYTASVDACRALVASALPGRRLHLGYGASGVFPYASLTLDGERVVREAPTLPLAILRAAVGVMLASAPVVVPT